MYKISVTEKIYKKFNITSGSAYAGFFADAPEFAIYKAAINEFGFMEQKIPSRPFIRRTIDEHKEEIYNFVEKLVYNAIDTSMSDNEFYECLGKFLVSLMKKEIETARTWAIALRPKTIKLKGHDNPLIYTHEMVDAISAKRG